MMLYDALLNNCMFFFGYEILMHLHVLYVTNKVASDAVNKLFTRDSRYCCSAS